MRTRYRNAKVLLLGLVACSLASCQDWLTIYPQTQIVEENFWEDRNDLDGVRYAAYKKMCESVSYMAAWGDLRSDNYTANPYDEATDIANLYKEICEARFERDSTSYYFQWDNFYAAINYCNKVLQHGDEVLKKDKQFTASEWSQIRAEMTTLRALNYFYLIRAFKDVPYSTKVINNDTEVELFGATNQLIVLDSLIASVESVQGQARNRFATSKDTKGLITNCAIYALLSDMYLWRASLHEGRNIMTDEVNITNVPTSTNPVPHSVIGDYKECIRYANLAMESLVKQNESAATGLSNNNLMISYGLENCKLYKNDFEGFYNGLSPTLTAYNYIFLQGNSEESIFELQFSTSDNRKNGTIGDLWGDGNKTHLISSLNTMTKLYSGLESERDSRMWYSTGKMLLGASTVKANYCYKWKGLLAMLPMGKNKGNEIRLVLTRGTDDDYRNWIVYRLSDVMLQKAEAQAALMRLGESLPGNENEHPLRYVNAIHRRWYCNDMSLAQPNENVWDNDAGKAYYNSSDANTLGNVNRPTTSGSDADVAEIAVLNERQIEFYAEGKRWFDLVRYAERHAYKAGDALDPRAADYVYDTNTGKTRADVFAASQNEGEGITCGQEGVEKLVETFMDKTYSRITESLKNRIKNRYGLYNLIYYKEINASKDDNKVQHLEQNPVWFRSKDDY